MALFKAFILKAFWNQPTTRLTIAFIRNSPVFRRLCGWESLGDVPDESTFSRAFARFADDRIATEILDSCTLKAVGKDGIFHVSHDSTAVDSRERGTKKPKAKIIWTPKDRRTLKQRSQDAETNFAELPTVCDWGRKLNSKGRILQWRGYKLHLAVGDGDIPLKGFLSSASLHDSHGGKTVRVRGNKKVFLHLMFGVLVIAAEQIIKLLP